MSVPATKRFGPGKTTFDSSRAAPYSLNLAVYIIYCHCRQKVGSDLMHHTEVRRLHSPSSQVQSVIMRAELRNILPQNFSFSTPDTVDASQSGFLCLLQCDQSCQ